MFVEIAYCLEHSGQRKGLRRQIAGQVLGKARRLACCKYVSAAGTEVKDRSEEVLS